MEITHLKYFYQVAKCRGFTKAAKALRVAQPGVSKAVKNLEDDLGVVLFHRDKRQVTLTDAGEACFERCRAIFDEIESLELIATSYRDECVGRLRIGASDNLCNYLLPELVGNFTKLHPKVVVRIYSGTSSLLKKRIEDDESEIGLFYTPISKPDQNRLNEEVLGTVKFALIVSGKKNLSRLFRASDFSTIPFIGSISKEYESPYPALRMLRSLGIQPPSVIETNNQETQKRLVLAGCGFSIVPRPMVQTELKNGLLKSVEVPKAFGEKLLLVKRKRWTLSKPAEEFKNLLAFALKDQKWFA